MVRHVVTMHPNLPNPRVFIGEKKKGKRYFIWYDGRTGDEVNTSTRDALELCMTLSGWQNEGVIGQTVSESIVPIDSLPMQKVELTDENN